MPNKQPMPQFRNYHPQPPTNSKDITKAKILHILKTHITMAEGTDPDEVYAELITEHIHRHFVLKELLDVTNQ